MVKEYFVLLASVRFDGSEREWFFKEYAEYPDKKEFEKAFKYYLEFKNSNEHLSAIHYLKVEKRFRLL